MQYISLVKKTAIIGLALATLGACASPAPLAQGESTKLASYNSQPKRLYIVAQMDKTLMRTGLLFEADHDNADVFQSDLTTKLGKCGIETRYRTLAPTALSSSETELLKAYDPDAVLVIAANRETKMGAMVVASTYLATLTDLHLKKDVWKSELKLNRMSKDAGLELSKTLLQLLAKNQIIPNQCLNEPGP